MIQPDYFYPQFLILVKYSLHQKAKAYEVGSEIYEKLYARSSIT